MVDKGHESKFKSKGCEIRKEISKNQWQKKLGLQTMYMSLIKVKENIVV